jgi:hypothetical protein
MSSPYVRLKLLLAPASASDGTAAAAAAAGVAAASPRPSPASVSYVLKVRRTTLAQLCDVLLSEIGNKRAMSRS